MNGCTSGVLSDCKCVCVCVLNFDTKLFKLNRNTNGSERTHNETQPDKVRFSSFLWFQVSFYRTKCKNRNVYFESPFFIFITEMQNAPQTFFIGLKILSLLNFLRPTQIYTKLVLQQYCIKHILQ